MGLDQGQNPLRDQPAGANTLSFPWTEYISKSGWTGDAAFRPGDARVVMNIIIHFSDLLKAVKEILGYGKKNDGLIDRKLPWRHPLFTWMYANSILKVQGIQWQSREPGSGYGPYSGYGYALISVQFWTPPYKIKDNASTTKEQERFVERMLTHASDSINIEKGQIIWATTHAPPSTIVSAKPFHTQLSLFLSKVNYQLKWCQVPDVGLFTGDGFEADGDPTNIFECVNGINSGTFIGKPAQTLRCDTPQFIPYMYPVEPWVLGLNGLNDIPRMWDVVFNLLYFDPPLGNAIGPVPETQRGWNNCPDPFTGLWHPVTRADGSSPIHELVDFDDLFRMND